MPTSARTSLGFFGRFADVGIRAPEQNGLLQQPLAKLVSKLRLPSEMKHFLHGVSQHQLL